MRRVFPNPNCATAFDTEGSEPYGLLRLLNRQGYLTPFPSGIDNPHYYFDKTLMLFGDAKGFVEDIVRELTGGAH